MKFWRTIVEIRAIFFKDGKEPKYSNHLRAFGELGVVAKGGKKKLKGKLENHGDIFFSGYAKEHAGDVYRMINVQTRKVTETRNVTFVGKMLGKIYDLDFYHTRRYMSATCRK